MGTESITGTGMVSSTFSTASYGPVKTSPEIQQVEKPEPERMPEENKGNNIDVSA